MPSTLAWLDHDASARERTRRILALFQESSTQDQLGLGGVRDSFSDLFFPGTSTIQTRLRYFLFVPWIYEALEEREVPSSHIAARAREEEIALVDPLLSAEEEGVFGRMAGGDLKRLPSEVYWGGLGSWGIRRFDASREQYHQALDEIYRRRKLAPRSTSESEREEAGVITWHPELPPPPESFPERSTLTLEREEAEFLRDRIVAEHPSSLLAWMALNPVRTSIAYPWMHPALERMPEEHRSRLHHARLFSEVMSGAPVLYNLMLCEMLERDQGIRRYREMHEDWCELLDTDAVGRWVDQLFAVARSQGDHTITPQAEDFVRRWVRMTRDDPAAIIHREDARALVRHREMLLKGQRSLFRNRRAREERYRGGLGVGQLSYRWPDVQELLADLHDGLVRA